MSDEINLTGLAGLAGATAAGTAAPKKTKEVEALEAKKLQLELKALELQVKEREANLQDLEERLAERELKRENKRQRSLTNGATLKQTENDTLLAQKRCNHRKGGTGAEGVVGGKGDSPHYSVLKHTFANGDLWVRCLRCGKTWKPPVAEWYKTEAEFLKATVEYETAVNFQTLNIPSGAVQFRFSDNGAYYREVTRNTTLR
jgi:hypothetical protein